MTDKRIEAVEHYLNAMRTGEAAAAGFAAAHLAPDASLAAGRDEFRGRDAVLRRISGKWPLTAVYVQGVWTAPRAEGEGLVVEGRFPGLGAAPAAVRLAFAFDPEGRIQRVVQETTPQTPAVPSATIPDVVRALVNGALANATPMSIAYVDEAGLPAITLRGSVQVYDEVSLSAWLRNGGGGMARAIAARPALALLYRDNRTRTTLIFKGKGRIVADEEVRRRVFDLSPEVEQTHDPDRKGVALIVDLQSVQGGTPLGPVRMERS